MAKDNEHDEDLNEKLKAAGIDLAFVKDVNKLADLKKLVEKKMVKPEVYRQLEADIFRRQQERDNAKKKNANFLMRNFRRGKFNGDAKANNNPRFLMKAASIRGKGLKTGPSEALGKKIIEDELLRLGNNRVGKAKWRKVFVVLYENAIEYFRKEGDASPIRKISLDAEYFVSEVRGGVLKRADTNVANEDEEEEKMSVSTTQSDDIMDQPHLFLVSNLREKYYFAAEDEEKKQYWVMMITTIIRDLVAKDAGKDVVAPNGEVFVRPPTDSRTPEQIAQDMKARKEAYVKSQMKKTIQMSQLRNKSLKPMSEADLQKEEEKLIRQADRIVRQSIAIDMMSAERERAQFDLQDQEQLKRQIKDRDRALQQMQQKLDFTEEAWQKKYDELLEQFRKDARQRHEEKLGEHARIRNSMRKLKRQSVMPGRDINRDYENEIDMLKTKLKALESALKVDLDGLDWDGTLEDAEMKMKELMKDLMSEDPKVQQEAQTKFDQWDNIIRNHKDYINREKNKWEDWENENYEKNLDALNEMRQMALEMIMHGCTENELMKAAGIPQKTAARIMKNNIFKFFWMDKDTIAKIHIADLLNRYAVQGLDIREMRAIYATLPEEFQNDSTGQKRTFRENIRTRLSELTKKESAGELSSQEKLNNAYRSKEVNDRPKIAPADANRPKPVVHVNKNMQAKALALQALLEKKAPPKAPKNADGAKVINGNDPKYDKYFKMKKMGLPDGAIMNKMIKDELDPNDWNEVVRQRENSAGSAEATTSNPVDEKVKEAFDRNPKPKLQKKPSNPSKAVDNADLALAAKRFMKNANQDENTFGLGSENNSVRKKLRPKKPSRDTDQSGSESESEKHKSGSSLYTNGENPSVKKKKKKKTLRVNKKKSQAENHLLMADTNALMKKVQLDSDANQLKRGSHGFNTLTYGSNTKNQNVVEPENMSKSEKRAKNMANSIEESLQELIDIILAEGVHDDAEGGMKTMKFGDLFLKYEKISDMLVGLLIKGKRSGKLRYRGDMLFKGIHDDIKITVVSV